jgi:hypothetical protein
VKTQYYTAASLVEFEATGYAAFFADIGALAMGSATYEWMLRHVVGVGRPWPYAPPTWVFSSRTLPAVPGADLRFVRGGRGKPLLPRRIAQPPLQLTPVQRFGPGMAELRYTVPRSAPSASASSP